MDLNIWLSVSIPKKGERENNCRSDIILVRKAKGPHHKKRPSVCIPSLPCWPLVCEITFKLFFSLSQNWHKACFHCDVCKMVLTANNFVSHKKRPYCSVWVFSCKHLSSPRLPLRCDVGHLDFKDDINLNVGPSRHNPRNNTFTSVYETPININAKKQRTASSEVRRWRAWNTSSFTRRKPGGSNMYVTLLAVADVFILWQN